MTRLGVYYQITHRSYDNRHIYVKNIYNDNDNFKDWKNEEVDCYNEELLSKEHIGSDHYTEREWQELYNEQCATYEDEREWKYSCVSDKYFSDIEYQTLEDNDTEKDITTQNQLII